MRMWQIFRNLFKLKPKKDKFIDQIIHSNAENWSPPFHQLPKTTNKTIYEYLQEKPEKEKIFFTRLEKEIEFSIKKKSELKLRYIFALGISLVLFLFLVVGFSRLKNTSSNKEDTSKNINFQNLKIGEIISTSNSSVEIIYNESLKFLLEENTKITVQEIPSTNSKFSIFVHFGKIHITSHEKQDFSIYWNTKKFSYTPLGTIASLQVDENSEILEVLYGYFLRKDLQTGEEKLIGENSKEIFTYSNSVFKKNTLYKVLATIHLKDGQTFTGYYYEEDDFIYIETATSILKFRKSEVELIE